MFDTYLLGANSKVMVPVVAVFIVIFKLILTWLSVKDFSNAVWGNEPFSFTLASVSILLARFWIFKFISV